MIDNPYIGPFAMATLAVGSVGLWTLRVALAARGVKGAAAVTASVEAVVFALAFSHLSTSLASPGRVLGYAGGVALGTLVGLTAEERLSTRRHAASRPEGCRGRR